MNEHAKCETCSAAWEGDNSASLARRHALYEGHASVAYKVYRYDFDADGRLSEVVADLDELGLPDDTGAHVARRALREAGFKVGNSAIYEAVRRRKNRRQTLSADLSGA